MATVSSLPLSPETQPAALHAPLTFKDHAVEMTPPASPGEPGKKPVNHKRNSSIPERKPVPGAYQSQMGRPASGHKDAVHAIRMVVPGAERSSTQFPAEAFTERPGTAQTARRDPLLEYDEEPRPQYAVSRPGSKGSGKVVMQHAPTTRPVVVRRTTPPQQQQQQQQQQQLHQNATITAFKAEHGRAESAASTATSDSAKMSINNAMPQPKMLPYRTAHVTQSTEKLTEPQTAILSSGISTRSSSSGHEQHTFFDNPSPPASETEAVEYTALQYHHHDLEEAMRPRKTPDVDQRPNSRHLQLPNQSPHGRKGAPIIRPDSTVSSVSDNSAGSRRDSPNFLPRHVRAASSHSMLSHNSSRLSFMDQLDASYPQQRTVATGLDNAHLQNIVGQNAHLLRPEQTLDLYRQNARKTNDMGVQYEFALYLIQYANELVSDPQQYYPGLDGKVSPDPTQRRVELIKEARQTLERLANRSYPYAQYYLGDAHSSGMFGKIDNATAFRLFVSAAKHGHAEGAYRAALSYEFGWGTGINPAKAVNFYQAAASKSHPGAMLRLGKACCFNDLGFQHNYKEGVKWLKRASESADTQYPQAPYELGLLHETGFRDLLFKDEAYTAQLFALAASLGHAEANYRLGDAYENGKLGCPRDAALSVHYYTGAAMRNHPAAMMALCGWYLVGAQPVLDKDEAEAFEWAKRAAEHGLVYAEYAVGYFTEMGIGTKRDPLEAKVWYVKAAEHGDERAKNRLATISAITSGKDLGRLHKGKKGKGASSGDPDDKDCIIM